MPVILSKFFKGRFRVRHIRIQNHISVMLTRLSIFKVFIPNLYGLTYFHYILINCRRLYSYLLVGETIC